jgi:hypothetical protein
MHIAYKIVLRTIPTDAAQVVPLDRLDNTTPNIVNIDKKRNGKIVCLAIPVYEVNTDYSTGI